MKKFLVILLVVALVLTTGLAGCGKKEGGEPQQPTTTQQQQTTQTQEQTQEEKPQVSGKISYMHWGDDYERAMYESLIKDYMSKNPGTEVVQIYTPDDYYTKLQTMITSNTLPDLFWFSEGRVAEYAKAGILEDLGPVYEKYPSLVEDLIPNLRKFGQYEGKDIAAVKDWTSYVMYLNLDLFKEAGVEPPTSDWTMEDYLEIAKKMTKKEGDRVVRYGVIVNNYRADWIAWLGAYNAEWFKDGKANFSDPKCIQALKPMYDAVKLGYAPSPATISAMGTSEDRMFITGMVAMYPSGRWAIPSFRAECDFEWDAIELPTGETKCVAFICGMIGMSAKSQNKDLAADFLAYQLSRDGLMHVMPSALALPAYQSMLEDPEMVTPPPSPEPFIKSAAYCGPDVQYQALMSGGFSQLGDAIYAELSAAFNGDQTLEQACQNIDATVNGKVFK